MIETLRRWAAEVGYAVAWGPLQGMREARAEIAARRGRGELDARLYETELQEIVEREEASTGATAVVVAVPRPAHRVEFETGTGRIAAVLPPTYVRYRATFEEVRQDLAARGLPGARVEHLGGPVKSLAARLGLVLYGRNNVTYVPGLGSFIQLCAFSTDASLPAPADPEPPSLLPECDACGACVAACPTSAIDPDRVLLHAERCLTFVNENPGAWPSWLEPGAHNCLLGCLRCQEACPVNPALEVVPTGLCFSAEETRALLSDPEAGGEHAETGVRHKMAWLGQPYAEPVLGRNLRALLVARRALAVVDARGASC